MRHVQQILDSLAPGGIAPERIPISWSAARLEGLRRAAADSSAQPSLQRSLAPPLLQCAAGEFDAAEPALLRLLGRNIERCANDRAVFAGFLEAVFTAQRFDLVAAMLRDFFGFAAALEIAIKQDSTPPTSVKWSIAPSGEHKFDFSVAAYRNDMTGTIINWFQQVFPLLARFSQNQPTDSGAIFVNLGDLGNMPGLAFCDSRPDRFLVPDRNFMATHGYAHARQRFGDKPLAWQDRAPVAFWRGATSGVKSPDADWRSLERSKLCMLARHVEYANLFDVGIASVVQFGDPKVPDEIAKAGLIRDFVPWQHWDRYRYHIDIDGNSNAWTGLFYRLLSGSPVLKIESPRGFVQWFYDRLVPWQNYVPVAPDMSDLVAKLRWLRANPAAAEAIGQGGRALAESLTYEREVERAMPVISAAFRQLNGQSAAVAAGPYGRPALAVALRPPAKPAPSDAARPIIHPITAGSAKMPRYVIHIGPHKTGTTYLQARLAALRPHLAERGILYPSQWDDGNQASHLALFRRLRAGDPALAAEFAALNRTECDVVVLSAEDLADLRPEEVTRLCELIGGAPTTIVFYCRRWSEVLASGWQENVKQGRIGTFPEFCAACLMNPFASHLINYNIRLERYRDAFGKDALKLVSYNHLVDLRIDLFQHFADTFLGWRDPPAASEVPRNASLGAVESEILRALNALEWSRRGRPDPALSTKYLRARQILDTAPLVAAMQKDMRSLTLNEENPGLQLLHRILVQRYGDNVVEPRPAELLFMPKSAQMRYIGINYLLAEGVHDALLRIYRQLPGGEGIVLKPGPTIATPPPVVSFAAATTIAGSVS